VTLGHVDGFSRHVFEVDDTGFDYCLLLGCLLLVEKGLLLGLEGCLVLLGLLLEELLVLLMKLGICDSE
jgi:hypothetical protein